MRLARALACAAVAAAFAGLSAADPADAYWVYFGTYTSAKNGSKGIYRAKFDPKTGKLSEPEVAAELGSPSFVNIHPSGKFLYAVGEGGGKDGGPVVAFGLDPKTGALTKLNELKSGGGGPCHVAVSPTGKAAVVANYGGGSSAVFRLADDGSLAEQATFTQHTGASDPTRGNQKGPHGHCGAFDSSGKYALVVDLGIDKVKVFQIDPATGKADDAPADIAFPQGTGPRHIAISPAGDVAYVCGEINSTVNVVKLDLSGGKSEVVQTLSTLPQPTPGNSTAEVVLSPDGKFVYVSNRGHNSIAVFKVGPDKKLTAAGHITGDIKTPRNFNIDPTGKWMLIASQAGDKVGVWELDPATGGGKETGTAVKVGSPVCVKFVPVAK